LGLSVRFGSNDSGTRRKEEAISEAKRAIEILPTSKDAMIGPLLVKHLTIIYAWANERNLAFEQINILVKYLITAF
jgi:hypothetical protein